jgi:hypothetical protein
MRQPLIAVPAVLACIALSVACDNSGGSTSPTTPVVLTTETFTGTVQPAGSDSHNFTVAQQGEVDVTLTSAGPPPTIFMGLGLGTPGTTSGTCALQASVSISTQAGSTPQLPVTAPQAGIYCFSVYDIGNQTAAVDYTVTVAHP